MNNDSPAAACGDESISMYRIGSSFFPLKYQYRPQNRDALRNVSRPKLNGDFEAELFVVGVVKPPVVPFSLS